MSAVRRNGRRTIFCWCKSACAKAPAAQEKPVRTLSAQEKRRVVRTGEHSIFRALRADAPRKRPHPAQKRSVFLYAVSCCDKCAGKYTVLRAISEFVPRKGDVDRNLQRGHAVRQRRRRPRKGDVDRNFCLSVFLCNFKRSSPARGTWIEMNSPLRTSVTVQVVPRKGDVDRNFAVYRQIPGIRVVPRKGDVDRNLHDGVAQLAPQVVPRKGDVDRNVSVSSLTVQLSRRPPQGGRG